MPETKNAEEAQVNVQPFVKLPKVVLSFTCTINLQAVVDAITVNPVQRLREGLSFDVWMEKKR